MTKESFENAAKSLVSSIQQCMANDLVIPSLILIYSGIDTMAWLNMPRLQNDVKRKDFVSWVDKYLLPDSNLPCTALELYAARCGVVHSYSPTSKSSREGKAREIFYAWGVASASELQERIDFMRGRPDERNVVVLHVDDLRDAFLIALYRFAVNLPDEELIYSRADQMFAAISSLPPLP